MSESSKKSVFITGGAGFIGRWLARRCLDEGYQVTLYDNLCAGRVENIAAFSDEVSFYEADVLDTGALEAALEETAPQLVFHLAAHHFIPYCNDHPEETIRVNVEGTQAVLSRAAAFGAEAAVVASTGGLYPSLDTPLGEDVAPAPPDIYGLSKLLAEQVTAHYARTTGLRCVAARLFNTYGPFETNPHLLPHIMESLQSGPSVELGNIYTKRDYIYVEDVAALLLACAHAAPETFTTVNLGTGVEYSAEEIVETLGSLTGTPIEIDVDESRVRAVDKMHQRADTTRLEALTGQTAAHSLEDGLGKLLRSEDLLAA